MFRFLLTCCALAIVSLSFAQTQAPAQQISKKRPLTAADYDRWQSVRLEKLSNNGQWVSYQIDPQEGDGLLLVTMAGSPSPKYQFARGYDARFSADSRFLVAKLKAPLADTRKAKLKKKKPDEMPKDSLVVVDLTTGKSTKFPNVKSYMLAKEGGTWVAFLQEHKDEKPAPKATATKDSVNKPVVAQIASGTGTGGKKVTPKKPKGDDLVLLNMADGFRQSVRYVSGMAVSENGRVVVYARESVLDSLKAGDALLPGVFTFNTDTKQTDVIDTTGLHKVYKGLAADKAGGQIAWMASADSAGTDQKVFRLYYKSLTGNQQIAPQPKRSRGKLPATTLAAGGRILVADTTTTESSGRALPNGWSVNEYAPVRFSDDGQRLYFATSPVPPPVKKDTLTPDDEKVKMDVWTWTDSRIQPMQQKRLKEEKERGYATVYDLTTGTLIPLASREVPTVRIDYKANPRYWLGISDMPYQVASSWDPGHTDLYLVDSQTGKKTKIANDVMASETGLSPGGKYAYWFDERDTLWRAWSVTDGKRIDLTRGLPDKFFDEEHDTPNLPGSYGAAGWTTGDRYFWVYDRYDIWQLDPTGNEKPRNLTDTWGRTNKVRLRRVDLEPTDRLASEPAIDPAADLYLTGFWESDKHTGILRQRPELPVLKQGAGKQSGTSAITPAKSESLQVLLSSPHRYFGMTKVFRRTLLMGQVFC